jgi:hyperosmotically inducible protein
MLPQYEVFDSIGYRVNGNTVTLFGKVRNAINRSDAERSVKRIAGVDRVVNDIEVLPLGGFDESIRVRLYNTLAQSGGLSRYLWTLNPPVRLIVDRGHVSLEGFVSSRGDYNTMNILANGVSGVFSVTNNLTIDKERVR